MVFPIRPWSQFQRTSNKLNRLVVGLSSAGVPSWTDSKTTRPSNPWESFGDGTRASTDIFGESPVLDRP